MAETRKLAAILAADVAGYSKLASADEERTLARLRALRSDLIDPTIPLHHGRVVKRTGDGVLVEFRNVVDAVRCAIEVQNGMAERNAGLPPERRIEFRVGIHVGDVVEESDGDLMGDGVNIAARFEGIAEPGGICLSEDAYRQVRDRLRKISSISEKKNSRTLLGPLRVYAVKTVSAGRAPPRSPRQKNRSTTPLHRSSSLRQSLRRPRPGIFRRWRDGKPDHRFLTNFRLIRDRPQHGLYVQRQAYDVKQIGREYECSLRIGGQCPAFR